MPETYFTAWGSLLECLKLQPDDTLLIRGATCALGYAAIQMAKAMGFRVVATTHRENKLKLILDADEQILDQGRLTGVVHGASKALELVGAKTVKDTLTAVEKGGIVCNTGVLGGVSALNGLILSRTFQTAYTLPDSTATGPHSRSLTTSSILSRIKISSPFTEKRSASTTYGRLLPHRMREA